jgi:hypothetical protein
MNAKVVLHRRSAFVDRFRSYAVIIDGDKRGTIKNDECVEFDVPSGAHSLRLSIDWCRSNVIEFEADPDQPTKLVCRSNVKGLMVLAPFIYAIFARNDWIRVWNDK